MRLAIVHKEKCKPTACGQECKKFCPVEKKEADSCVTVKSKARIDEKTCVGCGICVRRCPFEAIEIINLPSVKEEDIVYRFGENGFALYGLPEPKIGHVLGLLGRNGIGKSTAIEILAGKIKVDVSAFKGTELQKYFDNLFGKLGTSLAICRSSTQLLQQKKVAYKPQNLSSLAVDVKVMELLKKRGKVEEIKKLAKELNVSGVLENKMNKLSGGELQRIAILAASLGDADIYFYDEPLAFLDISERLRVSDFIARIAKDKTVVVVEHDLLILDYLTDYLNIFFGSQGAFGLVSGVKSSKAGVNAYLHGFLKEENLRIRDKELNFNFTKNKAMSGKKIGAWDDFEVGFESGFNMKVKAGEIHENHVIGILGKNGTGKTSFVRALAGEIETSRGKIDLGKDIEISYKPQYLFTKQEEQVRDVMIKEKMNKKISSMFNLGVLEQKKINELSGGELQRFSIARCLAKDADLYLIDEPSAYLDVEERISVAKAIKDIMSEKEKTAFVVDHDLLLISYLADNVILFKGEPGVAGESSGILEFEDGISQLLKELDVTLRKDKESGRPRINKRGSVLDREQKGKGKWVVF